MYKTVIEYYNDKNLNNFKREIIKNNSFILMNEKNINKEIYNVSYDENKINSLVGNTATGISRDVFKVDKDIKLEVEKELLKTLNSLIVKEKDSTLYKSLVRVLIVNKIKMKNRSPKWNYYNNRLYNVKIFSFLNEFVNERNIDEIKHFDIMKLYNIYNKK